MAQIPGIAAMPTTLANALLGVLPEPSLPVIGPDRIAALVPMYEEEVGAARALASLLGQSEPLDRVVVSINGGRDRTPEVVAATLAGHGYALVERDTWAPLGVPRTRWRRGAGDPDVVVVEHPVPTAKAESLNLAVAGGLVDAERVLVVDGDTVLDPDFVAAARRSCYRLRRERGRTGDRWVLEDVALVSGAVTAARPETGRTARLIAAARDAEYAFSVVIRRGQTTRVGRGPTFGASRLFTVVGCGFIARRDAFPVPGDTLTEDHDFTVQELAKPASERSVDVTALHLRGFRVLVDHAPRPLADVVTTDAVVLRRAPEARFEPAATMATEDPRHLGGYLVQVERWVGGALEVVAKRAGTHARRRVLPPNARFALLAAQLENLAGLLLLLALPAALGLTLPWEGSASVAAKFATWLLADATVTGALVFLGAWVHARARGRTRWAATRSAAARVARGLVPLLLLRPVNALAYATSLTLALPRAVAWLARRDRGSTTTVWGRPSAAPRRVRGRTVAVAFGMAMVAAVGFVAAALPGWLADPTGREAWRVIRRTEAVRLEEVARLPLVPTAPSSRTPVARDVHVDVGYCPPAVVAATAPERRALTTDASYAPLGGWAVLTLARLAPLAHALEEAATAYDVPAVLLLQVLLNESYLDPLAEGPTDDLGLAQVTSDALTLLRAISEEPTSRFANPALFARPFSVFDPEFSMCAGAAKLAWARHAPGGADDEVAYARYINPVDGVVGGAVSTRHRPLVDAFVRVGEMAHRLAATVDAYRRDPASVTERERALLQLVDAVAAGDLDVEGAYRAAHRVVEDHAIEDVDFFERVLVQLYDERLAGVPASELWARGP